MPTCHRQRSSLLGAPTRTTRVRGVVTRPSGTRQTSGRCTPWGLPPFGASRVTCTKPHGSPWSAAAGGAPRDRRCGRAWSRSRREASGAGSPRRPSTHGPRGGGISSGSPPSVPRCSSAWPPRWQKRCRGSLTRGSPRRPMRWHAAIDASVRCHRVATGCGCTSRAGRVLRSLGGAQLTPKAGNKPLHSFIVHELEKPGNSATVSLFTPNDP